MNIFTLTKKLSFAAILVIVSTKNITAQCSNNIPAITFTTTVIKSNTTISTNAGIYWVCSGYTLTDTKGGNMVYLEPNAKYIETITGDGGSTIFAKTNATVTLNVGGDAITHDNNVTVNGSSSSNLENGFTLCTPMSFNYSQAPSNGCSTVSGIETSDYSTVVNLNPNPAKNSFVVLINPNGKNINDYSFIMYDLTGREIKRLANLASEKIEINCSELHSGIYMYRILNNKASIRTGKLILE